MSASKPEEIQFELRATLTLKEWCEIRDQLKSEKFYGPTQWLRDAIAKSVSLANAEFRHFPDDGQQT